MTEASHQGIMHSKHSRNIHIVKLAESVQANPSFYETLHAFKEAMAILDPHFSQPLSSISKKTFDSLDDPFGLFSLPLILDWISLR